MTLLRLLSILGCCLFPATLAAQSPDEPVQTPLFVAGDGGFHTYRIPSLIVTAKGTLLAFCERRATGRGDSGDIDTVVRRSTDGGKTWSAVALVADDGPNTIGNPCPVVDRATGTLWLPLTHNLGSDKEDDVKNGTGKGSRSVWMCKSDDDGQTFSKPVDITKDVKKPDWSWYATGPGCGIQLASGRLLIPCDHRVVRTDVARSHAVFSDDHGATWQLGGVLDNKTNECQAVELADGSVQISMRSLHGQKCRAIATSRDGGVTWSETTLDKSLSDPVCQASFIRFSSASAGGKNRLLFANPSGSKRDKLAVRVSYDEGKTWSAGKQLTPGLSAYSALAVAPGGEICCLYERGEKSAYETIVLARFSLSWLTDGKDNP